MTSRDLYVIMREDTPLGQTYPYLAYSTFKLALKGLRHMLELAKRDNAYIDPKSDMREGLRAVIEIDWETGGSTYLWIDMLTLVE